MYDMIWIHRGFGLSILGGTWTSFFPDVQMSKIHQSSSQEQYSEIDSGDYVTAATWVNFTWPWRLNSWNLSLFRTLARIWALEVYDPSINGNTMKVEACLLTIFKKDNMPTLEASFSHLLSKGCFSLGISESGESWIQNLPFLRQICIVPLRCVYLGWCNFFIDWYDEGIAVLFRNLVNINLCFTVPPSFFLKPSFQPQSLYDYE